MIPLGIRQISLVAVGVMALSWLYFKTQTVDQDLHQQTLANFRVLKEQDSLLKQDVLRARTGLLNHYDTLVTITRTFNTAIAELRSGSIPSHDINRAQIRRGLEQIDSSVSVRWQDVERFKMKNAILKNSLSYLPVVTGGLVQALAQEEQSNQLSADLSWIVRDTLIYNLNGDDKMRAALNSMIAYVRGQAGVVAAEREEEIENALAHVEVILSHKPMVDDLLARITTSENSRQIDDLVQDYGEGIAALESEANDYRLLLYALSILLMIYIVYILIQLRLAAKALEEANEVLEQRVADRTQELVDMNNSLRIHLDRICMAMERAEEGDLGVYLPEETEIVYATLYKRFNRMIDGIKDEAQILKVAQELSEELEVDALLTRIMRTTTELLNADRSTIFVHDPKTKELWSRVAEGMRVKEIRIPENAGIAGKVFMTGTAENVIDPYAHELFNAAIDKETGYKTESILCMPIIDKAGNAIGVTQVLNKRGGSFLARDEARLKAFTAQVSISLHNARLFSEVTQARNHNAATLNSLSNGVITFNEMNKVSALNPAAARILSVNEKALIGLTPHDIFGQNEGWVIGQVEELFDTGQADSFVDVDLKLDSGQLISTNISVVPLRDEEDETIGGMVILEDITQEKRVKSTMARYMTKEIAEQLLEAGEDALGGRSQTATVLFSDIRSFTTISETLGARGTVSMLNEYFTEMVEVIFKHEGILDKYIGDAIMAVFGTPFPTDNDTDNAIIVANRMMEALRELNVRRASEEKNEIHIGIGLSTGELISGNIGSLKRMDYTVIGDSVNLAARLEGATKYYGVCILVSEFTVKASNGMHKFREIDLIIVKGKTKPVAIYEALGHHTHETFPNMNATLAAFEQGLSLYRQQNWQGASQHFSQALEHNPDDGPSKLYLERCAVYEEHPPETGWTGVWEMTSK